MRIPLLLLSLLLTPLIHAQSVSYDPLSVPAAENISKTLEAKDADRERILPLRVYLPASEKPAPVILFSHGLGGSRDNNPYLGNHWAKRGYMVVFVQHPGSDESVWKDLPAGQRMAGMKNAASLESFMDRMKDVPLVIDRLEKWNAEDGHFLKGRLDMEHLGMSGHSFGAKTTQAVSGQAFRGMTAFLEKRVRASVMMSPSLPKAGDPAEVFGVITIPCLLMTGTNDDGMIGDSTPEQRRKVFPALAKAPAWQVVFDEAEHSSFSQRDGKEDKPNRSRKPILALTTAFWDAQLLGDKAAMEWLNGQGAREILEDKDLWEMNERAK